MGFKRRSVYRRLFRTLAYCTPIVLVGCPGERGGNGANEVQELPDELLRSAYERLAQIARDNSYVGQAATAFCLGLGPLANYRDPPDAVLRSVSIEGATVIGASRCASDSVSSIVHEKGSGRPALLLSVDSASVQDGEAVVFVRWLEHGTSGEWHRCQALRRNSDDWQVAECELSGAA
jgi:hypothetical protein